MIIIEKLKILKEYEIPFNFAQYFLGKYNKSRNTLVDIYNSISTNQSMSVEEKAQALKDILLPVIHQEQNKYNIVIVVKKLLEVEYPYNILYDPSFSKLELSYFLKDNDIRLNSYNLRKLKKILQENITSINNDTKQLDLDDAKESSQEVGEVIQDDVQKVGCDTGKIDYNKMQKTMQKKKKKTLIMKTPQIKNLDATGYPRLSQMDEDYLNRVLDGIVLKANPGLKKEEITEQKKMWSARMLEMDLTMEAGYAKGSDLEEDD